MVKSHFLSSSSLKYIASISEKAGQLKYISTLKADIDFNKKSMIKITPNKIKRYE